ncbi:MAG: CHAT domain-containing protein, partial [Deltaproteobacteria bacterium]|nr:CHAT domain-containing protein [Deltaproteobacteria bacterium]
YLEGQGKAQALRGAQLLVMNDKSASPDAGRGALSGLPEGPDGRAPLWEGTGFSHPLYWAPFVIIGDWR